MFEEIFNNVRQTSPLIHSITNYVTVNDCANMLLACGASPIMADDAGEVEEISRICQGLVINIGTLSCRTIPSMLAAGRLAGELGHPVILDPVGAGASKLRTETALQLIKEIPLTVIRGNISEIKALANNILNENAVTGSRAGARGVDADTADRVTEENLHQAVEFAQTFALRTGGIVTISGALDIVADGKQAYCIRNGHPAMRSVTGTGCQLSALIAAFAAANPEKPLEAAAAAVCAMGLCGEIGYGRMGEMDGNASYRNYIIDAMYRLTPEELEKGARYRLWNRGGAK